jgi:hypothetical protein
MSINYWFERVIDAYLVAVAQGRDWRQHMARISGKTFPPPFKFPDLSSEDDAACDLNSARPSPSRRAVLNLGRWLQDSGALLWRRAPEVSGSTKDGLE